MNEMHRKGEKKQGIAVTEWKKRKGKNAEKEEMQRQINGHTAA